MIDRDQLHLTRMRCVAVLVAGAALMGGCSGKVDVTPTQAASSPAATSAAPTPTPSSDTMEKAAIAAYKKAFETSDAYAKAGGLAPGNIVPPELEAVMTGQALDDQVEELQQVYQLGLDRQAGEFVLGKIRVSDKERAGSSFALESCEDGSSIVNKRQDGSISHGRLIHKTTYYAKVDGVVKMTYYWGDEVKKCPVV
ncbi:hypothetical protein [Luteococcus sp.]|uniref:hypothetical protein n=1 Tax=Luteococcus sp. TaxID=1969402 RepID=UPI0037357036